MFVAYTAVTGFLNGCFPQCCSRGLGKQFITDEKESRSLEMAKDRPHKKSFAEMVKERGIETTVQNPVNAIHDEEEEEEGTNGMNEPKPGDVP